MARLEVIPGLRFTCTACGDCCTGWNVPVGEAERARIERLGIDIDIGIGVDGEPTVALPGGRRRLARRADGACVFLGERRQCLIHERAGAEAKPLACRLYPFSFERVGDRIGVDVAFSCRAVSEGRGAPLGERLAEWEEMLAASGTAAAPLRHRLTRTHAASAAVCLEVEATLVRFLLDPAPSLLDRARACLDYVNLATTGDPATAEAARLREALARALPAGIARRPAEGRLDPSQRAVFRSWLYLALNPAPADIAEWPARRQAREAERRDALAGAFRDGTGRPWIDNQEIDIGLDAVARTRAGVLAEPEPGLLARFLAAKIVGQRFLRAGDEELPLVDAVKRLLVQLPVVAWTAKALTAGRGAPAVEAHDLVRALRLADRTLGTLSLRALPRASREAFEFVLGETDVVVAAWLEVMDEGGSPAGADGEADLPA